MTQIERVENILKTVSELAAKGVEENCFASIIEGIENNPIENAQAKIGELREYLNLASKIAQMSSDEYNAYAENADFEAGLIGRK